MTPRTGLNRLVSQPVRGRVEPLSRSEKTQAERVAARLRDELRGLVQALPAEERGASAAAKALGLDRATCQRIVAAVSDPQANIRTLVNLPGLEGLRLFTDAVGRRLGEPQAVEGAVNAIVSFEHFLGGLKVSQRGLRRLLDEPGVAAVAETGEAEWLGQDDPQARGTLFNAAAHVVGRWTETLIGASLICPVEGNDKLTRTVQVRGHLGHRSRLEAPPLELGSKAQVESREPRFTTLDEPGRSGPWGVLLVPFCSKPLPVVTTRRAGGIATHVIEHEGERAETPLDVVIANKSATPEPHPATLSPAVGEVSTIVRYPTRRLVQDVWLHKEIARRCVPTLETHLWTPSAGHLMARWSTRVPGGPTLTLLGQGLARSACPAWDRHAELLAYSFEHAGWDAGDFVGYRCEVEYPLWRCSYHFLFEFGAGEE